MQQKECYLLGMVEEVAKKRPNWSIKRCDEAVRATLDGIHGAIANGYTKINFKGLFCLTVNPPKNYKGNPFNNPEFSFPKRKVLRVYAQKAIKSVLSVLGEKEEKK